MLRLSKYLIAATALTAVTAMAQQTNVYISDSSVTAYDPIFPTTAYVNWESSACTVNPDVNLTANWVNPHPAYTNPSYTHPWQDSSGINAMWINAWEDPGFDSIGTPGEDGPQSWTRYSTEVTGNGAFVLNLLADNCSWIYIDGALVGYQPAVSVPGTYPVTLDGTHTLDFIIFDGGGVAGGLFRLETNVNVTFEDTDDDGLTDAEEVLTETDPQNPDSDGDSYTDGDEVGVGSDPNDPNSTPVVDADGDGVFDDTDVCPDTASGAAVDQNGCSADQNVANACNCAGPAENTPWKNHGQYVSCVAKSANAQVNNGLLSQEQASALVSSAGQSDCGKGDEGKGKAKGKNK